MSARRFSASIVCAAALGVLSFGCTSSPPQQTGSGGSGTGGSASATGGATGTGGGPGVPVPDGGYGPSGDGGVCSSALADRVRITEIDVGGSYAYDEVDNNGAALGLTPLAISPIPGGGSRLAFLDKSASLVHIVTLDANDQVVAGSAFTLPGYDFQDIYADASGGTLLISRNAMGSTAANNNCGTVSNLCGLTANLPTAASCYDMYMVRFDGASETWATKLTDTTTTQPAYMTSPTQTGDITFVWSEYAHNGRIAFDGANYAGYYGIAISVSQACVGSSAMATGINIHQGDQMKVVSSAGALQTTGSFGIGCSHSGYERVIYDTAQKKFIPVCKNDAPTGGKSGRIALAPNTSTIYPVDLDYSDLGNVLMAGGGGDWIITTDVRAGQYHRRRQRPGRRAPAAHRQHHHADAGQGSPDGERHRERSGAAPGGLRLEPAAGGLGRVDGDRRFSRRTTRTARCTSRCWTARRERRRPGRRPRRPGRSWCRPTCSAAATRTSAPIPTAPSPIPRPAAPAPRSRSCASFPVTEIGRARDAPGLTRRQEWQEIRGRGALRVSRPHTCPPSAKPSAATRS